MNINPSLFKQILWTAFLLSAIVLAGCGTFQVDLEPTVSVEEAATVRIETPTNSQATALPQAEPTTTEDPDFIITLETDTSEDIFTLVGRAMTLDFPTGLVILLPETETPFADSNGEVRVRISEWAHIVDTEGAIVGRDELSRGVKLELELMFQDGQLTSEEVVVLEPGVPRPEDNPAYTDVTGLVTPLADPPAAGDGAIQLFEVSSMDEVVDPGSSLSLNWAFTGESGAICVGQVPRPVTQTCYQDLLSSGSLQVTVPDDAREAIIYSLYVQLEDKVESEDIRVPLSEGLGCQYTWYFETEFLLECPAGQAAGVRPQAQTFEEGLMVRVEGSWLGQEPYLFAFIWDEERDQYGFTEGPLLDTWSSELPEEVAGDEPPDGLFRPSRGFGLLWSGEMEIPQMGEPRTLDGLGLLGWATGQVFEYDAQFQCEEELFSNWNCYLSLPNGEIVSLPGRVP